ncbi:MAG: manganese efflux pump MntP family protein [Parabacteroides sp.]|nr:manganese efflux pump MntP family protein [Parabacteroides sp.]
MSFIEILLLAVGLSMDSLAVSVTEGALIKDYKLQHLIKIGGILGLFQAGFTLIGYVAGVSFSKHIEAFDHWIAFLLLLYLGGKMIWESFQEEEEHQKTNPLCYKTLCGLGIATSIDALAVGISLACLQSAIALEALTIGIVTFIFSAFGVYFGNQFKRKLDLKIELIGGLILIAIGTKILIEHIFFNG